MVPFTELASEWGCRRVDWTLIPKPRDLGSSSLRELDRGLVEGVQVGDQVLDLLFVLDARERHLGARNLRLRVLNVLGERRLVPGDPRLLVGVGIVVAPHRSGFAPEQPVEHGADRVLRVVPDLMAGLADGEDLFARGGILGAGLAETGHEEQSYDCSSLHQVLLSSASNSSIRQRSRTACLRRR